MLVRRWSAERSGVTTMIPLRSHSMSSLQRLWPEQAALPAFSGSDVSRETQTRRRRPGRACLRSAGFAWLFSYLPLSPSHSPPRTWPAPSTLFLLRFGGQILDHFAETFDSGRVVDLLPEYHGGGCNPNDLAVENLVSHLDEIALVVRPIDHGNEPLLFRLDDALQLDFVDEESRRSGRPLAGLQFRRGADQRLERIAPSLRIVVILLGAARLLEDLLQRLLHVGAGCRFGCRRCCSGGSRRSAGFRGRRLRERDRHRSDHEGKRESESSAVHCAPPGLAAGFAAPAAPGFAASGAFGST